MQNDDITSKQGLTTKQAQELLKKFGYNQISAGEYNLFVFVVKKIFTNPMVVMLLILSALYWLLDDKVDSIFLLIALLPIILVDVILEGKSRKALKALHETLTPVAKVIRDGKIKTEKIRNIVPGDILLFEEGQTLPADGVVYEAANLNISEAALSGEAIPIVKTKDDVFFKGTTILSGSGLGLVQKTGRHSKYGELAELLEVIKETKSPLQKLVDNLVKIIAVIAAIFVITFFIIQLSTTHQLIPSLIMAFTIGIAAVPEEFPLVLTLYLSLGAWRLSQKNVLVKSLPSVEALGGVDIICTDKTGTLTEGIFQLEEINKIDPSLSEEEIWRAALMACEIHPVDAMEMAMFEKGKKFLPLLNDFELYHDYAFEIETKHMSHIWKNKNSAEMFIAMKGAVEGMLACCDLNEDEKNQINKMTEFFASQGKRILGLAGRAGEFTHNRKTDESNLKFLGFIVFNDPIRESAKQAIKDCQNAGIAVKMLTGDHLLTACTVAEKIGLKFSPSTIYSGTKLAEMSKLEQEKAYQNGVIFARVMPEQKYEMVKVLQSYGHVVAMTGDGINDVAALKMADIGISMGQSATDVARSTAKMILMKSDFSGIVSAVFEGRQIFTNLYRSFSYLISYHIPLILLTLIPLLLKWPMILMPIHIILLEMMVDPVSAFTFENMKDHGLQKNRQKKLLSKNQILRSVSNGLLLSFGALWIFNSSLDISETIARTMAFATISLGNIFFIFVEIFPLINRRFYITTILLAILTVTLTMTDFLNQYLHFAPLTIAQFFMALGIGALASLPRFVMERISFFKS